jgi:type VI secretion system secreted protein Hcp
VAAADYFIKFDGIQGPSADAQHKGEVDVLSWSWGVQARFAAAGGGSGAGKAQFQDFQFVMKTSEASPQVFLKCAAGQHIKYATLTGRAGKIDFLTIKLSDVLITSFDSSANADEAPAEQVGLAFAKLEVKVTGQKPDGQPGAPVSAGWDVKANHKI